eukprot:gb/GECG01013120.1/.p1 GENE.gb/GECG01013120.1/~~gb/GECG01013120.1/.p1  ORF type:complete len:614 (+),score=54.85 gb/GECG01013120.1/:1-1842(+)
MAASGWIALSSALLAVFLSAQTLYASPSQEVSSDGGGNVCAGCTIILGLLLNYSHILPPDPPLTQRRYASINALQAGVNTACSTHWNSPVCQGLKRIRPSADDHEETPDEICRDVGICTNASCNLYSPNSTYSVLLKDFETESNSWESLSPTQKLLVEVLLSEKLWEAWNVKPTSNPSSPKMSQKNRQVQSTFKPSPPSKPEHLPLIDEDGDRYSTWPYLRGSDWRGKDCNDSDSTIYPGRASDSSTVIDNNCNGIHGVDPSSGKPYEDELCGQSSPRGVAILGDSAGAHFGIPTPRVLNSLDSYLHMALNELDWPQCSWVTGFEPENATALNTSTCEASHLPMISVYERFRQRNRCNHRDFQNIAVNGARTTSMYDSGIVEGIARNEKTDRPMVVFYALVGNDVCNPHPGSSHMTSPAQFKFKVLEALRYLDNGTLPRGSHVVFIGVLDGLMMWDTMAHRQHPDLAPVTYAKVWEFLNCLGSNPCWGYLNPDPKWRNFTANLAQKQNQQYIDIIKETQPNGPPNKNFSSFDLTYLPYPINESTVKWWESLGPDYHGYNLFESIGGGHPSQTAHMLTSKWIWEELERQRPDILGPKNPNNDKIQKLFGDQGGY